MKTALSIAGSDSCGGAGIQADIKTMTMNGVYAMTAITAVTGTDAPARILCAMPFFWVGGLLAACGAMHGPVTLLVLPRLDAAAGLDVSLAIGSSWKKRLVEDGRGDLLDAVICGLQASHAAALPRYGLPARLDPLEGWIASVPVR